MIELWARFEVPNETIAGNVQACWKTTGSPTLLFFAQLVAVFRLRLQATHNFFASVSGRTAPSAFRCLLSAIVHGQVYRRILIDGVR